MSEIGVGLAGHGFLGRLHSNAACRAVTDAVERSLEGRERVGPEVIESKEG